MGLGGISVTQLLIVLAIVVLLFGTKRLRGMGSDLGGAIKGFRKSLNSDEYEKPADEDAPARGHEQKTADADDSK